MKIFARNKKKAALKTPRFPQRRKGRTYIYVFLGVLMLVLGAYLLGLTKKIASFVDQHFEGIQKKYGLVVDEVLVEGRSYTTKKELFQTINVKTGMPIFDVSLSATHEKLLSLPWVKQATLERRLPDTLIIRLKEHKPVSLWQQGKDLSLIAEDGSEVKISNPEQYVHLPKVIGRGAQQDVRTFFTLLQTFPELWESYHYAQFIGQRRWSLVLKNQTRIEFPEKDFQESLERLKRYAQKHGALKKFKLIDLRSSEKKVIVQKR